MDLEEGSVEMMDIGKLMNQSVMIPNLSMRANIEDAKATKENDDKKIGDELNVNKGNALEAIQCKSCSERKYQDESDDSGVSFQTPTKIDPASVTSQVRGHEMEHVSREQTKADLEGKEVVSQSVTLHSGICEECGRIYVTGGTTRTVTKDEVSSPFKEIFTDEPYKGNNVDEYV